MVWGIFNHLVLAIWISGISIGTFASQQQYPLTPNQRITPGSLCKSSGVQRYQEKIRYCKRSVSTQTKYYVIQIYDNELGYSIQEMDREDFKIDHFIPLCMGGSNETNNLWPQHKSIFEKTDIIEQLLCERMAEGRMQQKEAIRLIRQVKVDPSRAESLSDWLWENR